MDTLISCLIHSFKDILQTNLKTGFLILESPSRFSIFILNGARNFKFPSLGFWSQLWLVEFYTVFRILLQDYVICRKREDQALIDLDIHHSKAPNSDCLVPQHFKTFINSKFEVIKQLQITKSLKTYFI